MYLPVVVFQAVRGAAVAVAVVGPHGVAARLPHQAVAAALATATAQQIAVDALAHGHLAHMHVQSEHVFAVRLLGDRDRDEVSAIVTRERSRGSTCGWMIASSHDDSQ